MDPHDCLPNPSLVSFPGPFSHHEVVVSEWRVPFLQAHITGGRITLLLDNRYGLELAPDEAEKVIPFMANAIAIALGYPSHPQGDTAYQRNPHPRPVRTMDIARTEPEDEAA